MDGRNLHSDRLARGFCIGDVFNLGLWLPGFYCMECAETMTKSSKTITCFIEDDEEGGAEFNDWPGEQCGRWRNGALTDTYYCLLAGTEFCDFDCPLRDWKSG